MKKSRRKILIAAITAAVLSGTTAAQVFAVNTVYPVGDNWIGSDAVAADPGNNIPADPGTAIATKKTITVEGVKDTTEGITVTAYQLVKGTYKDGKLTGYTLCDPINASLADLEKPSADEITAIANKIKADPSTTSLRGIIMTRGTNADIEKFTANVEAGLYIVLVSDSGTVVYNPAVVAVNVTNANQISASAEGGTVSMASYFRFPTNTFLKSSESSLNKDIVSDNKIGTEGDIVAYHDEVKFRLDSMTIPSYSDYYNYDVTYKITDQLDADGFAGIKNLQVQTPGTPDPVDIPASENLDLDNDPDTPAVNTTYYTITYKDKDNNTLTTAADITDKAVWFEVAFSDYYIRHNPTKEIIINYASTFREGAAVNYSEHKNTASVSYSNDPSDSDSLKTVKRTTYHYTLGIDSYIDGEAEGQYPTNELNKVMQANGTYTNGVSNKALSGATFTLYSDPEMRNVVSTAISNSSGSISFKGLDTGTYYLKETEAPQNYTLSDKEYQITLSAEIDPGTGIMTSYTTTTKIKNSEGVYEDAGSSSFTNKLAKVNNEDTDPIAVVDADGNVTNALTTRINPVEILNTRLAELPSTGGVGTMIITFVSAIGMALFLTIFFITRKKGKKDE